MGQPASTVSVSNTQVQLTRMEGSIERILDGQRRTEADVASINGRLNAHSDRIGSLERERSERAGADLARQQMSKYALVLVKLAWLAIGGIIAGTGAFVLRVLHL